jgi:hypothetical protein
MDLKLTTRQRERAIKRALRKIAQQRVATILQPGNVLVIECAPTQLEASAEILHTCHLRGWLEVIDHAVPTTTLSADGRIPEAFLRNPERRPSYRLTEAGWHVINGTHIWLVATFWVSFAALIAAALAIALQL